VRAIRVHQFGGPEVLTLDEVPNPVAGPGEVVIRNYAAGVNPVDAYIRAGTYARLPPLPCVPGWDGAGVVQSVGADLHRIRTGERVYFSGTTVGRGLGAYSQVVTCYEHQVHPLPAALSFAQGAAIGVPYATAHRALFHCANTKPGETVLVHGGSGGVGVAAIQLAVAHGCTVIATAGSEEGLKLVLAQGAHHAVRHGQTDTGEEVLRLTGGRGVDVIVEMLANLNLDRDLGLVALGGRITIVGNRGRIEIDPRQAMSKESRIIGVLLWNAGDAELMEMHQLMGPQFAEGVLKPVVGKGFTMAQAGTAHEAVFESGARGKVVIDLA